jgi:hypothetical protein
MRNGMLHKPILRKGRRRRLVELLETAQRWMKVAVFAAGIIEVRMGVFLLVGW